MSVALHYKILHAVLAAATLAYPSILARAGSNTVVPRCAAWFRGIQVCARVEVDTRKTFSPRERVIGQAASCRKVWDELSAFLMISGASGAY